MHAFDLALEAEFRPDKHVEKILARVEDGDVTVACWAPGQISPKHCHPDATEIYFCFQGGGKMRTLDGETDVRPGMFVVHPPGEVHEYENGSSPSLLFRVRYGADMSSRHLDNRGKPGWVQKEQDRAYFERVGVVSNFGSAS